MPFDRMIVLPPQTLLKYIVCFVSDVMHVVFPVYIVTRANIGTRVWEV